MNKVILLLVLVGLSVQANPSLGVTVNEKALVPLLAKVLPLAEGFVKEAVIPDISDSASYYSLDVSNLQVQYVQGLNTDNIKVSFQNNQLQVTVKGIKVFVTGDAHIKALFISADGVLSVTVNDITANILMGESFNNDRIQVSADQVSVNTGDINIDISGDLGAEVLSLFTSFIEGTVRDEIVKGAQQAISTTLVPKINTFLATVAYDYLLTPTPFSVHVNPTAAPALSNGLLSAGVLGYVYNTAIGGTPDIKAPVQFALGSTNSYAQVQISDYMLNSALWTLHQGQYVGQINQTLVDKLNQTDLDGIMNTDRFDEVCPGFKQAFGENKRVQLLVSTLSQGEIHASASGLEAKQAAHIDIQTADESGVFSTVGFAQASLDASVLASVEDQKVMIVITSATANDAQASHTFLLDNLSDKISKGVTELNTILSQGILIPEIDQGRLTNTALINHDDYIVLQSDYQLKEVSTEIVEMVATPFIHVVRECLSSRRFQGRFRKFFLSNQAKIVRLMALLNKNQLTA